MLKKVEFIQNVTKGTYCCGNENTFLKIKRREHY